MARYRGEGIGCGHLRTYGLLKICSFEQTIEFLLAKTTMPSCVVFVLLKVFTCLLSLTFMTVCYRSPSRHVQCSEQPSSLPELAARDSNPHTTQENGADDKVTASTKLHTKANTTALC